MDILCKAGRLLSMGRTSHQGHEKFAGERGTSFTKKFTGGFLLQTRADNRRGSDKGRR